ncbi:hypothetical protein [Paenibacillus sabinae]|uniref:Uncharacterized protein n=1 Tax=Paenibacillus sabinae T27 TaxID=1268072 RepID=X4ZYV1_9BACL|nr:hypothetical protein [Paenibacillus sabinae]AHV96839.1 hypothetical protein PSAB_09535 [Paenibacillus sabinae T27]
MRTTRTLRMSLGLLAGTALGHSLGALFCWQNPVSLKFALLGGFFGIFLGAAVPARRYKDNHT